MNEKYRVWGILVTAIYVILAIPIVASNTFAIIFSYMGSDRPWGAYLGMGPSIILAVLTVIMSMHSIRSPDIRSFFKMEITLILMLGSLMMFLASSYLHCFFALLYSLTGVLQIRKFWRSAAPEVPGKHLKRMAAIMLIPLSLSCASIAFGLVKSAPKMPADMKGIKFLSGSLKFYDDWSTCPSMGALAEAQEVQGMLFPKYTYLFFDKSGKLTQAQMREGGAVIQGVNCAYGQAIDFNKSGKITNMVLVEGQVINGKLYRAGDSLSFKEDGSIEVLWRQE